MIIEIIFPIRESGPCVLKISSTSPVAAEFEIIRTKMTGTISAGIFKISAGIFKNSAAASKKPDARKIPTAVISPINVGKIPATVFIPSDAPFKKLSKTGHLERIPNPTI